MEQAYQIVFTSLQNDIAHCATALSAKSKAFITVATIDQALQMNLQEKCHLVLLDGTLTEFSRVEEACISLRKSFDKPLLVIVADADEADLVNLHKVGVDQCIVKPNRIELLAAILDSWKRWAIALSRGPTLDKVRGISKHRKPPYRPDQALPK